MGAGSSQQRLGERVLLARRKLEEAIKMQKERAASFDQDTLDVIIDSACQSFETRAPFLEPTLLIAFHANGPKVKETVLDVCAKVLSAPIKAKEYEWFKTYVFSSSIWFMRAQKDDPFMYMELMDIVRKKKVKITTAMSSIFTHQKMHPRWDEVLDIKNQTIIERQDDKRVGLLQEKGILDVMDVKMDVENEADAAQDKASFIDSNVAINILVATAKKINGEFQDRMRLVMGEHGDFKPGPIKKVERCQSKIENDYADEKFPKSAKLLDLVRCSVTFNTVEQLLAGYQGLQDHINASHSVISVARVKNCFLDPDDISYRDIKLNLLMHSEREQSLSMICEVQLILNQYLHEKKRIHKLYSVEREQIFFDAVVREDIEDDEKEKDIRFEPLLRVKEDVEIEQVTYNQLDIGGPGSTDDEAMANVDFGKCSMDSELGLLGMGSAANQFFVVDTNEEVQLKHGMGYKVLFETPCYYNFRHKIMHHWVAHDGQKFLAIQVAEDMVKMFKFNTENKTFLEETAMNLRLASSETIYVTAFDQNGEHIYIVTAGGLQKRKVGAPDEVVMSISLRENDKRVDDARGFALSADGTFCVTSDENKAFVVDLVNKAHFELDATCESSGGFTQSACFIETDGETRFLAIAVRELNTVWIEIWDINKRTFCRKLEIDKGFVSCMAYSNNILAVGKETGQWDRGTHPVSLWHVGSWKKFQTLEVKTLPHYVHLTTDAKYLTVGGYHQDLCVVMSVSVGKSDTK